jgi:hypothetical protein
MKDGLVHYNGNDMQYLFTLDENLWMTSGEFYSEDAAYFKAGWHPTVIYRGYLNH